MGLALASARRMCGNSVACRVCVCACVHVRWCLLSALDRGTEFRIFGRTKESRERVTGSSNFGALGVFWNSRISSLFLRRKLIITKLLKQAHTSHHNQVCAAGRHLFRF